MSEEQKPSTEKPLIERYLALVDVVAEAHLNLFGATLEQNISGIVSAKAAEINGTLEKVFAVKKAGPLNLDTLNLIRKATLENAEVQKRTPAPTDQPTPEGTQPPNKINEMFRKAERGENWRDVV